MNKPIVLKVHLTSKDLNYYFQSKDWEKELTSSDHCSALSLYFKFVYVGHSACLIK